MSDVRGTIDISLRDGVTPNSRKINSSLSQVETKSRSAFGAMTQSSQRAETQLKQTGIQMNNTRQQSLGMATSIAGLAASFVALETTMTNIPKRLKAIEGAEVALARVKDTVAVKNVTLVKLELTLAKSREKGNKTAAEIQNMEDKMAVTRQQLATYTADLAVKQEDLNLKHADYADTLKLMATSIFMTFLTAGTSVTLMLTSMATAAEMTTGKFVAMKLATLSHSRALRVLGIDLKTGSLALRGFALSTTAIGTTSLVAVTGVRRLSLGIKGLFVAMGPIGWAIIGITTAMEVWNSNFLGIQNRMENASRYIEIWFTPTLQNLAKVVGFLTGSTVELETSFKSLNDNALFPPVYSEIEKADESTKKLTEDIGTLSDVAVSATENIGALGDAFDPGATESIDTFSGSVQTATKKLIPFANGIFDATGNVIDLNDRVGNANDVYLKWGEAISGINREFEIQNVIIDKNTGKIIENTKAAELNLKKNYDEILKNKPTGSALSSELDDVRNAIKHNLDLELQNIRNRAGVITSLANQELNFKFLTIRNKIQSQLRFAELQSQSFADGMINRTKIIIQSYLSKTLNNYANSNYSTGGKFTPTPTYARKGRSARSGGYGGVAKYSKQRYAASQFLESAKSQYEAFFGEASSRTIGRGPRRGLTSFLYGHANRLLSETAAAKDQLSRFSVGLDYTPRTFSDLIRAARPRRLQYKSGQRRVYSKGTSAIYNSILRDPTKLEAITQALKESKKRERIYNDVISPNSDLLSLQNQHGSISDILSYNNINNHQEKETLDRLSYQNRILLEANMQ